jgi:hypothetical protein
MRLHIVICGIERDHGLKASPRIRLRKHGDTAASRPPGKGPSLDFRCAIPAGVDLSLATIARDEDVWCCRWSAGEVVLVCAVCLAAKGAHAGDVDQVIIFIVFI